MIIRYMLVIASYFVAYIAAETPCFKVPVNLCCSRFYTDECPQPHCNYFIARNCPQRSKVLPRFERKFHPKRLNFKFLTTRNITRFQKLKTKKERQKCGTKESNYEPCTSKEAADKLFLSCCQRYLSGDCHFMCQYETSQERSIQMLTHMLSKSQCDLKHLSTILYCASQNNDNQKCCSHLDLNSNILGVGDHCLRMCDPGGTSLERFTKEDATCLNNWNVIMYCAHSGIRTTSEATIEHLPCLPRPIRTSANGPATKDAIRAHYKKNSQNVIVSNQKICTNSNRSIAFQAPLRPTMEIIPLPELITQLPAPDTVVKSSRRDFKESNFYSSNGINNIPSCYANCQIPNCCPQFACFSADTKVTLINGTQKRMDELSIDDWILSGDKDQGIIYARVDSWQHRMPEKLEDFIVFKLADGNSLKITKNHFIYRGDCSQVGINVSIDRLHLDMVVAKEVSLKDCLFTHQGNYFYGVSILEISITQERGIYAPMTTSGNLVVNNIYASCDSMIPNESLQNIFQEILNFWKTLIRWMGIYERRKDLNEVELIPGMPFLFDLLMIIVPNKF